MVACCPLETEHLILLLHIRALYVTQITMYMLAIACMRALQNTQLRLAAPHALPQATAMQQTLQDCMPVSSTAQTVLALIT